MSDQRPILTLADGTPLGKVTNFQACAPTEGFVHLLEGIQPCDVTPSKMTIEITGTACFDPFEAPKTPKKHNRSARRGKGVR